MPFHTSPTPNARRIRAVHRAGAVMVSALAALALSGPASALAATDQATTSALSAQHSALATSPDPGVDYGTDTGGFGQSVDCGTDPTNSVCDTGNGGTGNTGNGDTPLGTTVGRGECTDWALDRRPDLAGAVNGNAQAWTDEARAAGRPMSKTPSEGDLMVLQGGVMGAGGATGHVAYVESVERDANGNPTSFTISEQNWNGSKSSTSRTIPVSDLPGDGVDFIG